MLKPAREDYFWTRQQAARRLRAALRGTETRHIARLIIIGLYTGTRIGAMLSLPWVRVDVDAELIWRRDPGTAETKKRQPTIRIHRKLLPYLRRWKTQDLAAGITHVISFRGKRIRDPNGAWEVVRKAAGDADPTGRISCVTRLEHGWWRPASSRLRSPPTSA